MTNMKRKKYKFSKLFNKFLKLTLGNYLKLLFDYRIENMQLKGLKPPYVILANHTNFWDPFLLSMCVPEPVYFVTSDAYFRNPLLKYLLKLVGAIPKTKLVSDPLSVRGIIEVVRSNGVIGIYPEGRRNWDGTTLPLLGPTAKLIKSLNIPVVTVLFKGACLSMPRWATSTRRGKLTMTLSRTLEPNDIKLLSTGEIFSAISESLAYNEYDYQRKHMNPYKGRNIAEKLELFLFFCPECESIGSLTSSGNKLRCRSCSYEVRYNDYGFFENCSTQRLHYDNPGDWNLWQLKHLDSFLLTKILQDNNSLLLTDNDIIMKTGQKTGALELEAEGGTLSLYAERIELSIENKVIHRFLIVDIIGENIQLNNQLEFICSKTLYRYSGRKDDLSAYKWVKAIESLKRIGIPARYTKEHMEIRHNTRHREE
jgi:1-acyl-sn-glycerol-3-phosphate acyltransferase